MTPRALAPVAAALALACAAATGCGSSARDSGARPSSQPTAPAASDTPSENATSASSNGSAPLGDEDGDSPAEAAANAPYRDADDRTALAYGRPASAAARRAIAAVVASYYAAAARGDGAAACALLPAARARSAPSEYGQGGPLYLRGARGCAELLERLFAHLRGELASPVRVRAIRREGNRAEAFLASATLPASEASLVRERGRWRIGQLFATNLP